MVRVANTFALKAALDRSSGTVTNLLEELVGEGIDARARHLEVPSVQASKDLRVEAAAPLLHRAATLQGQRSGRAYVYAETVIATSRLPAAFRHRLESGTDPIGRILDEVGITVTRESLVEPDEFVSQPWDTETSVGDYLLARTYRIDSDHTPVMIVTEWFLPTLSPFLPSP
jgi:chorismate-pyruvate lyase